MTDQTVARHLRVTAIDGCDLLSARGGLKFKVQKFNVQSPRAAES
jgi:hypothetical protein